MLHIYIYIYDISNLRVNPRAVRRPQFGHERRSDGPLDNIYLPAKNENIAFFVFNILKVRLSEIKMQHGVASCR